VSASPQTGSAAPLILCIEDEEALRRDLAEELQEAGYRVIEAAGGADALSQLQSFRPDLILCDICMPGMDGYDLLQRFQNKADDYADVPFIFLTALADRQEVLDGKRRGADDYLVKPVDFDLLLATVDARLRQIRRIREQSRRAEEDVSIHLDAAARDPGIAAVLDLLSTAIILIDGARQVAFFNKAARVFADDCPDFRLALDQLEHGPRHRTGFSAWLDEMLAGLEEGSVSSFAFPRGEEGSDLMMVGCKLKPHDEVLALFMTGPSGASDLSPNVLTSLFGFTPTESLIAAALARGDRPADISTGLGIAQTTVAFHIRNIFQKTGVSRQASLVALLLTSPASIL
jgi:DNA-binding NarL/FixJ family response regulator